MWVRSWPKPRPQTPARPALAWGQPLELPAPDLPWAEPIPGSPHPTSPASLS